MCVIFFLIIETLRIGLLTLFLVMDLFVKRKKKLLEYVKANFLICFF